MGKIAGVLAVALLATGCLEPDLVACGSVECADGQTCVANAVCGTPDAVAACTGLADGTACQSATATGYCATGVCQANVCGDGVVTGNEVCDGSDVTVSCAGLGFYTGTPTCTTACSIDSTGCSGRCGDGVIQGSDGEICDGAPPTLTCADFGRDYGALGCDRFCGPDIITDCGTYNWQTLLPAQPGIALIAAAINAHGAIGINSAQIRVAWDDVTTSRDNPGWTSADADATTMLAWGSASLGWFDGTTWHDTPTAAGATATLVLVGGMDGIAFALAADCTFARVDLTTGVTASLPSPGGSACRAPLAQAGELYTSNGSGVWSWDGSAWQQVVMTTAAFSLARGRADQLLLEHSDVSGTQFSPLDLATGVVGFNVRLFDEDGVLASDRDGDFYASGSGAPPALYFGAGQIHYPNLPEGIGAVDLPVFIGQAADGSIMAANEGVYRLGPATGPIAGGLLRVGSLSVLANGDVASCGTDIATINSFGATNTRWTGLGTCEWLLGDPSGAQIVGADDGVFSGTAAGYALAIAGYTDALSGSLDDAWALTTDTTNGVHVNHNDGTGWTEIAQPLNCVVTSLAGGGGSALVVTARCGVTGGVFGVFQYVGTWTQLVTTSHSLALIVEASDGTLFVSGDETARVDGDELTAIGPGSPNVVAVSATEVYIDLQNGVFQHQVGGAIATVRLPTGPLAVAPTALYVWNQAASAIYAVPRMPTVAPRAGI